jgi:hypothetical protein
MAYLTKQELHQAILQGHDAIHDCLLTTLFRPWTEKNVAENTTGETDYEDLMALLKHYDAVMKKYMQPKRPTKSANDETGETP